MMTDALRELTRIITPILKRHGICHAAVFGSTARGEAGPQSDLDLLVDFPDGATLFSLAALKLELEDAIGKPVDLVNSGALHPLIRDAVLAEQQVIL